MREPSGIFERGPVTRSRSGARVLLATSIVAIVGGAIACQGNPVIIGIQSAGIESDGGVSPRSQLDAAADVSVELPDAEPFGTIVDAALAACLADGACPYDETCEYPVDAGCGARGECVGPPPAVPPPPGGGAVLLRSTDTSTRAFAGYTPVAPPACDASGEATDADVSDAHDTQDARGD